MIPAIALDSIAAIQHVVTFNELLNSVSAGALFGVKQKDANGLKLTLRGGNFPSVTGAVVQIPDTSLVLTASATNYIAVDTAGVISKVTAAPAGWPGPLASGARALYQLTVGTNAITSGTCYVVGKTTTGPSGPQGPIGATGAALWFQRKRAGIETGDGGNPINGASFGFETTVLATPVPTPPNVASTSLVESIPRVTYSTGGGTTANINGGVRSTQNLWYRGDSAGRGGFDFSIRFAISSTAGHRKFIGLKDNTSNPTNTVDPSAFINCFGMGVDDGDTNFTIIHNDGSGTATKTATSSSYPGNKGATNLLYELRLWCDANDSGINWSINDPIQSLSESGFITSDIPANTQFLGWVLLHNTGSGGVQTSLDLMQVIGNSRY